MRSIAPALACLVALTLPACGDDDDGHFLPYAYAPADADADHASDADADDASDAAASDASDAGASDAGSDR